MRQRILTAAFSLIVVVAAIGFGSAPWKLFVTAVAWLCAYEFAAMAGQRWSDLLAWWAYLLVTLTVWWPQWLQPVVFQIMIAVTFFLPVLLQNRTTLVQSATVFAGALYIGLGAGSLVYVRDLPQGLTWLFLVMVPIWATDTAAYFVGSLVKGPKLWPAISPKKTVSGAVAGVAAGGLAAALMGALFLRTLPVWWFIAFGVLVSVAGQIGDLVESAYKRSVGVKDSGRLLPGHGGVLDRVDSLLFAAPLAAYSIAHPWLM